jgi:hypothetical protein
MPDAAMPPIEGLGVDAVEVPEGRGEMRGRGLQEPMLVSVHQDPGVAAHPIAVHHRGQGVEKAGPIRVVSHDRQALVAPRGDVRDAVCQRESERPSRATGRGGPSMVTVQT